MTDAISFPILLTLRKGGELSAIVTHTRVVCGLLSVWLSDPTKKNLNGQELISKFDEIVKITSNWTPNLFLVPFGKEGQSFLDELTQLAKLFVSDPESECYALSATILAPTLILQKPSRKSKAKEHKEHLKRRLELWSNGKFDELVKEGLAIQKPLCSRTLTQSKSACDDRFINLMRRGQSWLESERHSLGPKPCTPKV
eukprot:sb/3470805/